MVTSSLGDLSMRMGNITRGEAVASRTVSGVLGSGMRWSPAILRQ